MQIWRHLPELNIHFEGQETLTLYSVLTFIKGGKRIFVSWNEIPVAISDMHIFTPELGKNGY